METLRFKTNINCSGCVAKVTTFLNETVGEGNWQVDTKNPEKTLTVQTKLSQDQIQNSVKAAGFRIEKV